jgi:CMP-N,N'-diacetyllegionaminic acid synthase
MRILALIPARGGSKRLPGKNTLPLHGKPLIVWSIDAVRGVEDVCDVLVSTDDPAIARISTDAGGTVPWLRPAELATDAATSVDVALHALDWYERTAGAVDGLLLLQPTSPFRSRATVIRGIDLFREHGGRPVVSVSPAAVHPLWCFKVEGDRMRPYIDSTGLTVRSQDLPPVFALNGSVYLIAPETLRARRTFVTEDAVPLLVDSDEESLDIDTEADWRIALAQARPR